MVRRLMLGLLACTLACADASHDEDEGGDDAEGDSTEQPAAETCPPIGSASTGEAPLTGEGMSEGDELLQVDGAELSTPEQALAAYARLREASRCTTPQTQDANEEPTSTSDERE